MNKSSMNTGFSTMKGSVCLVTGATSGIGKAISRGLAALGAEIIITGRNKVKAEKTVQWIQSETSNDAVHYLLADFTDLQQVRALAFEFKEHFSRLDVLVNNAGAFFYKRHETSYGVEMTLLVNHLAPFLLTNLLLDTLQHSTPSRIINVSSDAQQYGTMDFNDLKLEKGYSGFKAYARSKLANILFTNELARRLVGTEITVNALHPGHVATNIWGIDLPFIGPILRWMMGLFALTPEQGADNSIYLATSQEVAGITGCYFVKREAVKSSPISYDVGVAKNLWQVSEALTAEFSCQQ